MEVSVNLLKTEEKNAENLMKEGDSLIQQFLTKYSNSVCFHESPVIEQLKTQNGQNDFNSNNVIAPIGMIISLLNDIKSTQTESINLGKRVQPILKNLIIREEEVKQYIEIIDRKIENEQTVKQDLEQLKTKIFSKRSEVNKQYPICIDYVSLQLQLSDLQKQERTLEGQIKEFLSKTVDIDNEMQIIEEQINKLQRDQQQKMKEQKENQISTQKAQREKKKVKDELILKFEEFQKQKKKTSINTSEEISLIFSDSELVNSPFSKSIQKLWSKQIRSNVELRPISMNKDRLIKGKYLDFEAGIIQIKENIKKQFEKLQESQRLYCLLLISPPSDIDLEKSFERLQKLLNKYQNRLILTIFDHAPQQNSSFKQIINKNSYQNLEYYNINLTEETIQNITQKLLKKILREQDQQFELNPNNNTTNHTNYNNNDMDRKIANIFYNNIQISNMMSDNSSNTNDNSNSNINISELIDLQNEKKVLQTQQKELKIKSNNMIEEKIKKQAELSQKVSQIQNKQSEIEQYVINFRIKLIEDINKEEDNLQMKINSSSSKISQLNIEKQNIIQNLSQIKIFKQKFEIKFSKEYPSFQEELSREMNILFSFIWAFSRNKSSLLLFYCIFVTRFEFRLDEIDKINLSRLLSIPYEEAEEVMSNLSIEVSCNQFQFKIKQFNCSQETKKHIQNLNALVSEKVLSVLPQIKHYTTNQKLLESLQNHYQSLKSDI